MKRVFLNLSVMMLALLALAACNGKGTGKRDFMKPGSGGRPYEMLVVMDNDQWERPMGRALFNVLDSDVPGLAQSERSFRISQIPPSAYDRMFKIFRNIIQVNIQDIYSQPKLKFSRDVYASPQMIMTLQAHDEKQLAEFLETEGQAIIDFFTKAEMNREIAYLEGKHNPIVSEKVKEIFDCDVWIPMDLNKYKSGKDFFWASTNKGSNDMNFVMYSYPYTDSKTFTLDYFLQKRDSVMQANIPGGKEGSYMTTNHDFVYVKDATVKNEYAQIARGLWRVKGDFMGGPFVSQSRVDEQNGRVVVVEGFVYAPESLKRDLIRKLEASLYTLQLPKEQGTPGLAYELEEIVVTPDKEELLK